MRPGAVTLVIVALCSSARAEAPDEPAVEVPSEVVAAEDAPPEDETPPVPDTVIRQRRDMFETGGAIHLLDEEQLEQGDYDDPHAVLAQVPGVYTRTEDGYGLRPNIGIRGVSSERSQKVTLMQDGVLFGPAPYSAPAAYYFPLMTRLVGVEVVKGPSAIRYGPHTIGGAIDLRTRDVPRALAGMVDLGVGSAGGFDNLYGKLHAHLGSAWDGGGVLGEVVHLETDGFKRIDGREDDNTGFSRTEAMLVTRLETDRYAETAHALELSLGIAREISHETYLGLTDVDFRDDPNRRYAATALDRMAWQRYTVSLEHRLTSGPLELVSTLYHHGFERAWRKLNRFRNGPALSEILADPTSTRHSAFYRILSGQDDSVSEGEALMIGTNDRSFMVFGAQTIGRYQLVTGSIRHKLELGLRLHHDGVERHHDEHAYLAQGGGLVSAGLATTDTLRNEASATAFAAHALWGLKLGDLTLVPGVRLELIATDFADRLRDTAVDGSQVMLLPGVGAHYALTPRLGVFAGVHRGGSPVAPGQPDEVEPEEATNVEAGLRWLDAHTGALAEVIGFYDDYDNLVGQCAMSSGCGEDLLDRQFNGGEVEVAGVEVALGHTFELGCFRLPARLAYTFTHAEFTTSFASGDPIFGDVTAGDRLPYVPEHQLSTQLGIGMDRWDVLVGYTFVDAMRERPGQGSAPGELTDRAHLVDASARVRVGARVEAWLRGDNLLGDEAIGSRRPFGARPMKPRALQLGVRVDI